MNQFSRIKNITFVFGGGLLLYLLYWRFQFALSRYFDADELAHLHWGYNFFAGRMPYTDFFYIFPPYFLFLLSGIWALLHDTVLVAIEARVLMFGLFLVLLATIFLLTRTMRNIWVGLLSVIFLSFLPIPYDKFIEVRPDLFATLLALMGIYVFILAFDDGKIRRKTGSLLFVSGLLYGLSIGVVPKTIFFVPAAFFGFCFWTLVNKKIWKLIIPSIFFWTVGFMIPVCGVLIFSILSGDTLYALALITKVASDASLELVTIYNHSFYMFPTHFFWPNSTLYGEGGMNFQYFVNLTIWIVGSVFAIVRLVGFFARDTFQKQLTTLLLSLSFFFNLYGFVYVFPLKHSQYLIPLAVFVCIFFADFMESIRRYLLRRSVRLSTIFVFLLFLLVFIVAEKTNRPKVSWTNTQDMRIIQGVEKIIPKGSYVFDLSGYALSYSDPYYYCCLPYGQYWRVLPLKPMLSEILLSTDTKYVLNARLDTLPGDERSFIESTFTIPLLDGFILSKP